MSPPSQPRRLRCRFKISSPRSHQPTAFPTLIITVYVSPDTLPCPYSLFNDPYRRPLHPQRMVRASLMDTKHGWTIPHSMETNNLTRTLSHHSACSHRRPPRNGALATLHPCCASSHLSSHSLLFQEQDTEAALAYHTARSARRHDTR